MNKDAAGSFWGKKDHFPVSFLWSGNDAIPHESRSPARRQARFCQSGSGAPLLVQGQSRQERDEYSASTQRREGLLLRDSGTWAPKLSKQKASLSLFIP